MLAAAVRCSNGLVYLQLSLAVQQLPLIMARAANVSWVQLSLNGACDRLRAHLVNPAAFDSD